MNEQNLQAWITTLRTTDKDQCHGQLAAADFNTGEVVGYCCLGLGSTLVPDLPVALTGLIGTTQPGIEVEFGEERVTGLAPNEFLDWLGLDHGDDSNGDGWDITPDWTMFQLPNGSSPDSLTAAGLNDDGFTFAQIADIFAYFGISDS